ncbi:hypothetical protein T07_4301 [Trichinella nelsoni]|uniref:Uncharacterized protein n=1 Tax=Trichinella nelsoni TaxID=6336 RepID=A0A0V0REM9_9BILA|nr:hypothetical protein T07_4301 [Trichinella nelsoni]
MVSHSQEERNKYFCEAVDHTILLMRFSIKSHENFCLLNVLQSRHSRTCLSENVDVTLVSMIVGVRKSENADHTRQIADGTKQIEDDKKQIEDDTKQIEDDTKQNKRRQSSWDPNSVGLGLGYFERVKLSHNHTILLMRFSIKSHENFCLLNVLQSRHSRTCLSENVDVTLVSMIVGVRKSENADHTRQIADGTKQIEDDKKQIEDDTKQIEDDTKQNKRRQSSWDPNSVGLGLGYFERKFF